MHLDELTGQHERWTPPSPPSLERLAALADPAGDFAADRAGAASRPDRYDRAALRSPPLEEQHALSLFESE